MALCEVSTGYAYDCEGKLYEKNAYGAWKAFKGLQQWIEKSRIDCAMLREYYRLVDSIGTARISFDIPDDIVDTVKNHRYYPSGNPSCMASRPHLLRIYEQNRGDIAMVRITYSVFDPLLQGYTKLGTGSVIVWRGKRRNYVDRLYPGKLFADNLDKDRLFCALERWLGDDKPLVSLYHGTICFPKYNEKVSFRLKWDGEYCAPYMDSLNAIRALDDSTIVVSNRDYGSHSWQSANAQEGTHPETGEESDERAGVQCCNCGNHFDDDDIRHTDYGDAYCQECWDECFAWDEIAECEVSRDDIEQFEVCNRHGSIDTVWSTDDSLNYRHYRCDDRSCVQWVHENASYCTIEGEYICVDDIESGEFVETAEGDIMHNSDAFYWGDEWHSDESEESEESEESV